MTKVLQTATVNGTLFKVSKDNVLGVSMQIITQDGDITTYKLLPFSMKQIWKDYTGLDWCDKWVVTIDCFDESEPQVVNVYAVDKDDAINKSTDYLYHNYGLSCGTIIKAERE